MMTSNYPLLCQNILWDKEYKTDNGFNTVSNSYTDYDGNILLLGTKDSITTKYNTERAYIRKISAKDGKLIWHNSFGDLNNGTYTRIQKLELLPDSTILALGTIAPYVTYENKNFAAINIVFPYYIHFSKSGEVIEKHFDSLPRKEFYDNVKITSNKIGKSFIAAGIDNSLIGTPKLNIQFFDTNGRYFEDVTFSLIELEIYWANLKWAHITSKNEIMIAGDILDSKDKSSGNLVMIIDSNRKILRKSIFNYNLINPKITDGTTDVNGNIFLYGEYNSNDKDDSNQLFIAEVNNKGQLDWLSNFGILGHAYTGKILVNGNKQIIICGACTELDSSKKAVYGKRKNYLASITSNKYISKYVWGDYNNGIGLSGINIFSEDTVIVAGTVGYPKENRLGDNEVYGYASKLFINLTGDIGHYFAPNELKLY